jgi:hypothetical protein
VNDFQVFAAADLAKALAEQDDLVPLAAEHARHDP